MGSEKGGLFVRDKAYDFFNHINRELVVEVIETPVYIYKIAPYDTTTNIYGESDSKKYYSPIKVYGLINNSAQETNTDDFGPDTTQTLVVAFNREQLRIANNVLPEVGDIIQWNDSYFEIGNVDESKFPGGQTAYDFTFICYAHMTKRPATLIDNDMRVGSNIRTL